MKVSVTMDISWDGDEDDDSFLENVKEIIKSGCESYCAYALDIEVSVV